MNGPIVARIVDGHEAAPHDASVTAVASPRLPACAGGARAGARRPPRRRRRARSATNSGSTGIAVALATAASVPWTGCRMRLSRIPGKSPKTTTSAPSGARVRISVAVMSVRWCSSPSRNVGRLAEHDPLEHPEQVRRRRGSSRTSRRRRPTGSYANDPTQGQELADEAGQARQPGRGEHEEAEDRGVDRGQRRQARPSSRSSGRGSARRSRRRAGTGRR